MSPKPNGVERSSHDQPKLDLSREYLLVAEALQEVEQLIFSQAEEFDPAVAGYLDSIWRTKGKRLRPAITLFSAGTMGGISPAHIKLAMIVELIHLASLVHDDVMDHAELRRGVLTAYKRWGAEIAVLLGDCLFAHALKSCADLPPEAAREIASAANEVCSGEILQTQRQFDLNLDLDQYYKIIGMKTAALFRICAELSAVLHGCTAEQRFAMRQFGQTFGVAYQVYDDCLDFFHVENATGKTAGTDIEEGKITLPLLLMLQRVGEGEHQRIFGTILHGSRREKQRLSERVLNSDAMSDAVMVLENLFAQARAQLAHFGFNPYRQALESITRKIVAHLVELLRCSRSSALSGT
ncbi:MAG: polyprenyl synthetase family protein [Methylacidiphilales bacterium]|nr:polyprenyl synthetase family protein [Candidatus Methylacidiphilales bacterium]MDW8349661.1 polyprenyl synthetase family protein [Verrucomicrobiae bacterium]